ncbi:fibroblast growth factor 1-like [Oculina patagonica]
MYKVLLTNVVSLILLLIVGHSSFFPSEAVPVGKLPKGGRWLASGSDDDTEREETYVTPEHKVYMRLTNPGPRIDRSIHKKSSTYIRRGRLFNRNGYLLRINNDGTIDGTTDKTSPFANLEFHSVGTSLMMILGITSKRYLSINDNGFLHGSEDPTLNSVFKEAHEENMFHSFLLYKDPKWLVGIKKNGKAKRASRTQVGQKSTQFLITYT